jgi:hypothetical protein
MSTPNFIPPEPIELEVMNLLKEIKKSYTTEAYLACAEVLVQMVREQTQCQHCGKQQA